jgi:hypothetical protein
MADPTRHQVRLVGPGLEPVDAILTTDERAWIDRLYDLKAAAETTVTRLTGELEAARRECESLGDSASNHGAIEDELKAQIRDLRRDLATVREELEREKASHAETVKLMRDYRRQVMDMEDARERAERATELLREAQADLEKERAKVDDLHVRLGVADADVNEMRSAIVIKDARIKEETARADNYEECWGAEVGHANKWHERYVQAGRWIDSPDAGNACSNFPHERCMEEPFGRLCWRHSVRAFLSPGGAPTPDVLRTMTAEQAAAFEPISDEAINEALAKGMRAKWAAEHPTCPPLSEPPPGAPPSDPIAKARAAGIGYDGKGVTWGTAERPPRAPTSPGPGIYCPVCDKIHPDPPATKERS